MDVIVNGMRELAPEGSKPLMSYGSYHSNLLLCLGYGPLSLPLAELLKLYHHLDGKWLVASPIHWEATHNDAMIVALDERLELSEEESLLWFLEVKKFLKEDNFDPIYHSAGQWLFNIDDKPIINSKAAPAILHQSVMPILNAIDATFFWQRLITEMQMYLSSHPLNRQREAKLAINGLWFWGEGEFKQSVTRPIATDDEVLLNHLKGEVSLLTPDTALKKDHLVLITKPQEISLSKLEEKTKKSTTHWYWNNQAYSCETKHWWSRLWR